MAMALWNKLRMIGPSPEAERRLRTGCRVVDVRLLDHGAQVTWVDPDGEPRSLAARHVVMAGPKHVCKYVLHDLGRLDPDKLDAMHHIDYGAYLVANILLEAPIERDFYDVFLVGDKSFPMHPGVLQTERPVIDVLRGDYHRPNEGGRSVLTLYWPLPFAAARVLVLGEGFSVQARRLAPQVREVLALLGVPVSAVRQVRLTRWGHAMPLATPQFIADGRAARVQRPLGGCIHFVNQDNWALPAVENSLLDARRVAATIDRDV